MNIFQRKIGEWLLRPAPDRALNVCYGMPFLLATDVGLQRDLNQDRVSAMRISEASGGSSLLAVAVADGMGGMKEGEKCAAQAISSFFYFIAQHRTKTMDVLLKEAVLYANDVVNHFLGGDGGATFSAVVLSYDDKAYIVNVGDSRIYAYEEQGEVERLTVDDSLEEAVGGYGRELLQFIGMGDGLNAHIDEVSVSVSRVLITTDGVHYIEPKTFNRVLVNSPDQKAAAERLVSLSRWCGGHDNATVAILDLNAAKKSLFEEDGGVQLWDPFGNLSIMWLKYNELSIEEKKQLHGVENENESKKKEHVKEFVRSSKKKTRNDSRRKKEQESSKEPQLNIEIVPGSESGDDNER